MKISIKRIKKAKIIIEISKDLDNNENIDFFTEKVKKANETLSRGGLPRTDNKI